MDKHFKTLFILNLISTVIILTLGVLLSIGTLSVTEVTKMYFFIQKFYLVNFNYLYYQVMQEKINAKEKTIEGKYKLFIKKLEGKYIMFLNNGKCNFLTHKNF